MKRKLVKSYGNDNPVTATLPEKYLCVKQYWLCVVSVEQATGQVDEYDIKPHCKLYLEDFLEILQGELEELEGGDSSGWQVDIYRMSGRR